METGYRLDGWGSIAGKGKRLSFLTASSPTQPPIQRVPGHYFLGGKAAEAWISSLSSI
jgi:hypothetical protein